MKVRLIVGLFDGEDTPLIAGCIDQTVWEIIDQEESDKWAAEIRVKAAGPAERDYEWREIVATFDDDALLAAFDTPEVVGTPLGPDMDKPNDR